MQAEVRRLHGRVLAALLSAGVSAISVPVSLLAENRAGVLARFDATPFARVLGEGAVPVAFGDVVPDSVWGRSILSADTIAVALVHTVRASRAIFVSDVPGVLADPRRASSVLPEISPEAIASLALPGRGAPDVTGGIRGKAASMLAIAALGVDAGLISGLSDGSLARALRGEAVYGSWARAAAPGRAAPSPVADERP